MYNFWNVKQKQKIEPCLIKITKDMVGALVARVGILYLKPVLLPHVLRISTLEDLF
jgi:hypothetical protein